MFQLSLGMEVGVVLGDSSTLSTVLVMVVFMGIVVVVLLNMLIAIMGDSYEKVKESERVEALRERAQIIVEAELSSRHRHKYHKYMHFVDATDSSELVSFEHWDGITGRVKQLLQGQMARLREDNAQLRDDINAQLKGEMDELRDDINVQLKGEMDKLRGDMDKLRGDMMRDIKELLASASSQQKWT